MDWMWAGVWTFPAVSRRVLSPSAGLGEGPAPMHLLFGRPIRPRGSVRSGFPVEAAAGVHDLWRGL